MADVFISYKKEDRAYTELIAAVLRSQQLTVWWDEDLGGGHRFRGKIEEELTAAGAVIVIWSDLSVRSNFVLDEANEAAGRNKLIPVTFDEGFVPPIGFREIQVQDLSGWAGDHADPRIAKLVNRVDAVRRGRVGDALSQVGVAVADAVKLKRSGGRSKGPSLINAISFVDFFGLPAYRLAAGALVLGMALASIWFVPAILRAQARDWWTMVLILVGFMFVIRATHQVATILQGKGSRQFLDRAFSFWTCVSAIMGVAIVVLWLPRARVSPFTIMEFFPFGFLVALVLITALRFAGAAVGRLVART